MNYLYLLDHKELFPYAIGITHYQFESILPRFSSALRRAEHKRAYEEFERKMGRERRKAFGVGRKPTLRTDRQKLFFILFYYKVYPTFRFAQCIFNFDKRNIQLWKEFLEPVLFEALGYQLELPVVKVNSYSGWREVCPALREFIVDTTERRVRRPKDLDDRKLYYSGKKKYHTVKNQIIVDPRKRRILSVSRTAEGKLHDKKLLEQDSTIYHAPPKARGLGDLGYQGAGEVNPLISLLTPFKKPKGKELSDSDKETNRAISSVRVGVEHPLAYLKHFNILSHPFRNRIEKAHQPFETIACIYNYTRTHH